MNSNCEKKTNWHLLWKRKEDLVWDGRLLGRIMQSLYCVETSQAKKLSCDVGFLHDPAETGNFLKRLEEVWDDCPSPEGKKKIEEVRDQYFDYFSVQSQGMLVVEENRMGITFDFEKIEENVDLIEFPPFRRQPLLGQKIVIGDLHSSPIKLLFFLTKEGVFSHMTNSLYDELIAIFLKNPADAFDMQRFIEILNGLEVNREGTLIFIGDELADRGPNDLFILKMIEKLHDSQVPFKILFSNHGAEFINAYDRGDFYPKSFVDSKQGVSLINMGLFLEKNVSYKEVVDSIVDKIYKPSLELVACTLDQAKNEITLYTHAPVDLKAIQNIAALFGLKYVDDTINHLAETIESINLEFQRRVVDPQALAAIYGSSSSIGYLKQPVGYIVWNRRIFDLERQPIHPRGYKMKFVHGHDGQVCGLINVFNLDGILAKSLHCGQNLSGEYAIIRSNQKFFSEVNLRDLIQGESCSSLRGIENKIWVNESGAMNVDQDIKILDNAQALNETSSWHNNSVSLGFLSKKNPNSDQIQTLVHVRDAQGGFPTLLFYFREARDFYEYFEKETESYRIHLNFSACEYWDLKITDLDKERWILTWEQQQGNCTHSKLDRRSYFK